MKNEFKAGLIAAVLIMGVAVLFSGILDKQSDVVPLFLVPAFLYAGYAVQPAGFKAWAVMTISITILLAMLYAIP